MRPKTKKHVLTVMSARRRQIRLEYYPLTDRIGDTSAISSIIGIISSSSRNGIPRSLAPMFPYATSELTKPSKMNYESHHRPQYTFKFQNNVWVVLFDSVLPNKMSKVGEVSLFAEYLTPKFGLDHFTVEMRWCEPVEFTINVSIQSVCLVELLTAGLRHLRQDLY
jgi:hypothetical protein